MTFGSNVSYPPIAGYGYVIQKQKDADVSWFRRLSNLLRSTELDRELDEELQFHIDSRTRDNLMQA